MNTIYRPMPIDRTLKALENIADSKGLKLEDVEASANFLLISRTTSPPSG